MLLKARLHSAHVGRSTALSSVVTVPSFIALEHVALGLLLVEERLQLGRLKVQA
jgi:hypothetical protein